MHLKCHSRMDGAVSARRQPWPGVSDLRGQRNAGWARRGHLTASAFLAPTLHIYDKDYFNGCGATCVAPALSRKPRSLVRPMNGLIHSVDGIPVR